MNLIELLEIELIDKSLIKINCDTEQYLGGCLRGVMVNALDCGILVTEFELQSRNYVHFRTNIPGKGMNPLILPAMG